MLDGRGDQNVIEDGDDDSELEGGVDDEEVQRLIDEFRAGRPVLVEYVFRSSHSEAGSAAEAAMAAGEPGGAAEERKPAVDPASSRRPQDVFDFPDSQAPSQAVNATLMPPPKPLSPRTPKRRTAPVTSMQDIALHAAAQLREFAAKRQHVAAAPEPLTPAAPAPALVPPLSAALANLADIPMSQDLVPVRATIAKFLAEPGPVGPPARAPPVQHSRKPAGASKAGTSPKGAIAAPEPGANQHRKRPAAAAAPAAGSVDGDAGGGGTDSVERRSKRLGQQPVISDSPSAGDGAGSAPAEDAGSDAGPAPQTRKVVARTRGRGRGGRGQPAGAGR